MTDDVRAAAERILRDTVNAPIWLAVAAGKVAAAYLAEHPANDDEPVDAAWLESVPGSTAYRGDVVLIGHIGFGVSPGGRVEFRRDGGVHVNGTAVACPTRGHVRRLLAALGLEVRG